MKPRVAKHKNIPFDKIDFGQRFREEYNNIEDLQASIATNGLVQSLMVLEREDGGYTLIAGGRRYVALKGLKTTGVSVNGEVRHLKDVYKDEKIPCMLGWSGMTQLDIRALELTENVQRENLSPMEQVRLIDEIHRLHILIHGEKKSTKAEDPGWSAKATAQLIGKTPSYVSQALTMASHQEVVPGLKDANTWKEAQRMIRTTTKAIDQEVTLGLIREGLSEKGKDERKKEIASWYIVGDFFKKAKTIQDNSADLIEIDPPFGIDLSKVKRSENEAHHDQYSEWSSSDYMKKIEATLREAWRIAKDDSWLLFWFAPEPWFEPVFQAIKRQGWWVRRMPALWYKHQGQTNRPEQYLGNAYETFFYAAKGSPKMNRPGTNNVFVANTIHSEKKTHLTAKPVVLYQDIFETFMAADHRAVVPFAGSGNQLLALANCDRKGIGFDLSEEHRDSYQYKAYQQEIGKYQ